MLLKEKTVGIPRKEELRLRISKETKVLNMICLVLVLLAGVLRLIAHQIISFPYNHLIFTLFSAAGIIWAFQLRKRLLQAEVRRYLTGGVCLMILWMALRSLKYDFFPSGHIITRYAWYLYYLPMLFIPLLLFFRCFPSGKTTQRRSAAGGICFLFLRPSFCWGF